MIILESLIEAAFMEITLDTTCSCIAWMMILFIARVQMLVESIVSWILNIHLTNISLRKIASGLEATCILNIAIIPIEVIHRRVQITIIILVLEE